VLVIGARYLDLYFNVERICTLENVDPEYLISGYLRYAALWRPSEPGPLGTWSVRVSVSAVSDSEHQVTVDRMSAHGMCSSRLLSL
jgi:hypothetical protein